MNVFLQKQSRGAAMLMFLLIVPGLLELAIPLSPDDWKYRQVWQYLPLLYVIGLALTWRQYQ